MSEGLSRRNFLKGAALTGAALAGSAALAGCASGGSGSGSAAAADWMPASWDFTETDIVVVGYGGAGMWASLIGADEGGSSVTVLEKAPVEGGGNSRINNGEWTVIKDADNCSRRILRRRSAMGSDGRGDDRRLHRRGRRSHTEYADKYGMTYEVAEQALAGTIPEYWFLDDGAYCRHASAWPSVEGFGMTTFHELEAKRAELGLPIERAVRLLTTST